MNALREAIAKAGGKTALARLIGASPQSVHNWDMRGNVPAEFAPLIERETGIGADRLCPDVPWSAIRAMAANCANLTEDTE